MGREPTSGYCMTCRRRRVKCDRGLPACARCSKAGFHCGGYGMPMRMQHHVAGSEGPVRVSGGVSALNPAPMPAELSLVGFRDQIAFSFYFGSYRWAQYWRPLMRTSSDGCDDLIYESSVASTLGYLASQEKDTKLLEQATAMYSSIIGKVRATLARGSKSDIVRMSSVIGALSIYNYMVDQKVPYVHHNGIEEIARWAGPVYFQDEPNLSFFRISRMMLICASFAFKRATFLAEGPWKTVPFQPGPKSMEDKLLDVVVDLPGLAERVGSMTQTIRTSTEILGNIQVLYLRLVNWRQEWQTLHPDCARTIDRNLGNDHHQPPLIRALLSTGIELETSQQALEMLYYNSGMLYLHQIRRIIESGGLRTEDDAHLVHSQARQPRLRTAQRQQRGPLLLPADVEFPWQHGIEGLKVLSCLQGVLSAGSGAYVTFAPIGILYSFCKSLGIHKSMIAMLSSELCAEDTEAELGVYDLNGWETLHATTNERAAAEL